MEEIVTKEQKIKYISKGSKRNVIKIRKKQNIENKT